MDTLESPRVCIRRKGDWGYLAHGDHGVLDGLLQPLALHLLARPCAVVVLQPNLLQPSQRPACAPQEV